MCIYRERVIYRPAVQMKGQEGIAQGVEAGTGILGSRDRNPAQLYRVRKAKAQLELGKRRKE